MCICVRLQLLLSVLYVHVSVFFFFKQKTAYEMRISDWSSDVCSSDLLAAALRHAIGEPQSETRLVSGYFVPGRAGVDALGALAARGFAVAAFTNAFQSTDVWIVHAGYAERRKPLLTAGDRLFEMRGTSRADGKRRRGRPLSKHERAPRRGRVGQKRE